MVFRWYVSNVSIFFDCSMIYYPFWMFMGFTLHFYIIFETNLLTRGPARIAVFFAHFNVSSSRENQRSAQEVARRISGAVAGEVFAQVKTYQVPITNSPPSHYIICHLPLIFLSPTSPLPFYSPFFCSSFHLLWCLGSFARLVGIVVYLLLNREPKIYVSSSTC